MEIIISWIFEAAVTRNKRPWLEKEPIISKKRKMDILTKQPNINVLQASFAEIMEKFVMQEFC